MSPERKGKGTAMLWSAIQIGLLVYFGLAALIYFFGEGLPVVSAGNVFTSPSEIVFSCSAIARSAGTVPDTSTSQSVCRMRIIGRCRGRSSTAGE